MPDYTLYPKVTPDGLLPPKVLDRLDERYWNHSEDLPLGSGGNGTALDARKYGATGDGVTNDSAALQSALDAAAGKALFIPAGRYNVTGDASHSLRVRAGTEVFGEKGTVLFSTSRIDAFLRASSYESTANQVELAAPVGSGDRTITTKTDHPYKAGDIVKLQSQRIATSIDAGEWRLGWSTVGSNGPRFAESARITSVTNSRAFVLDTGLVFPGYRHDKSQETDAEAGNSTIIIRSDGAGDNVTIRDLAIEGEAYNAIRFMSAVNGRVRNVQVSFAAGGSGKRAVQFYDSYRCKASDVTVEYADYLEDSADHARYNTFHAAGSQSCGFVECEVTRGTQCYDITYAGAPEHTSLFCYVENSRSLSASGNPITMHPGTYMTKVSDNQFTECRNSGIAIRSNFALISNNQVQGSMTGTGPTDNPGIYCSEGGGKNSLITGNTVSSFRTGFRLNDGGGKPFTGWAGPTVIGNTFQGFVTGAARTRVLGGGSVTKSQGIILKQNTFVTDQPDSVGVLTCDGGRGVSGWSIQGNDFLLPRTGSVGVKVMGPSGDVVVKGNTFHSVGQPAAWDDTGVATGSPVTVLHWSDNTTLDVGIDRFSPPNPAFQIESLDLASMHLPSESYSLDNALRTARLYATHTGATVARGWPVDGFDGWVDVVRLTSFRVQQTGYGTDGRTHSRAWRGADVGWSSWKVT